MLRISLLEVCDIGTGRDGHWWMQSTHQLGKDTGKNILRTKGLCSAPVVMLPSTLSALSLLAPFR